MKKIPITIFLLLTILGVFACKDDLHLSDFKKLEGKWRLVKEVHQGQEAHDKNGRLIIDAEGNWRVEADGKTAGTGTLTLDPDVNPKTIDYTFTQGEEKDQIFAAIYELSGDTFRHCGVMNGERPKEFTADDGSENYLVTFQREK